MAKRDMLERDIGQSPNPLVITAHITIYVAWLKYMVAVRSIYHLIILIYISLIVLHSPLYETPLKWSMTFPPTQNQYINLMSSKALSTQLFS